MTVIGQCWCCRFEPVEVEEEQIPAEKGEGAKVHICELCKMHAFRPTLQGTEVAPNANVLRTICYVGNVILHELRKNKR